MTETEVIATLSPLQRVALTLWGEARGSSYALRIAIASAIQNRVRAQRPAWGLTADAVCLKRKQFSCWNQGDANHRRVIETAEQLLSVAAEGSLVKECLSIAAEVCAGVLPDTVKGATHYYSPDAMVPRYRVPAWAMGKTPTVVIDGTRFYAGIA